MDVQLLVVEDPEAASRAAARELAEAAGAGGHVALAGGSTPRRAYQLTSVMHPDWGRTELWWGDDRCVEPADSRSNYRLVRESLLDGLARSPRVVHRIHGELECEEAAALYDRELDGVRLDLAFLGLGTDGHTASLFPGDPALDETEHRAVAVDRPDVERVTMTLPVLNAAGRIVFLVVGAEKADAVQRAFAGDPSPEIPASLVRGETTVAILDRAAAARVR
jgi:6-phosphogluconolactonase